MDRLTLFFLEAAVMLVFTLLETVCAAAGFAGAFLTDLTAVLGAAARVAVFLPEAVLLEDVAAAAVLVFFLRVVFIVTFL